MGRLASGDCFWLGERARKLPFGSTAHSGASTRRPRRQQPLPRLPYQFRHAYTPLGSVDHQSESRDLARSRLLPPRRHLPPPNQARLLRKAAARPLVTLLPRLRSSRLLAGAAAAAARTAACAPPPQPQPQPPSGAPMLARRVMAMATSSELPSSVSPALKFQASAPPAATGFYKQQQVVFIVLRALSKAPSLLMQPPPWLLANRRCSRSRAARARR